MPGKRVSLGLKVTSDIKKRLDDAARASGRTQSQEAEARLERSFDRQELLPQVLGLTYGRQLAAMLLMLGDAMKATGEIASASAVRPSALLEGTQKWFDIPYAYDQAVRAANTILEALRPAGDPQSPKHKGGAEDVPHLRDFADLGERVAARVLAAVASWRSATGNNDQERARTYHRMLGRFTKRLKDTGLTVRVKPSSGEESYNEG